MMTKLPNSRDQRGFTIIELMVVMTIIVVLASMGLVQYRRSIIFSREAVLKEDLFRMRDAVDQYFADKNEYPQALDSLVSEGYLRTIPKDPFTNSETTWQTSPAELDPSNPKATPGIYDIKSGSDQTASDGTRYAEW